MSHRQKKSAVFEYFVLNEDKSFFVCQVKNGGEQCKANISAYSASKEHKGNAPTRASNLKRHLQRKHLDIYKSVEEKDKFQDPCNSTSKNAHQIQKPLTKYFMNEKVTISMTAEKFKKHIIELVVMNTVPLTLFSSPAFCGLNGEMAEKLGISLDRHEIRNMILTEAEKQKNILKKVLHAKFIFLKMDACTRHRVNYLAVNAQYIDDEKKLAICTLAVRDSQAQHSSDAIRRLIDNILKEFEIRKEQILSIVTDNATNMTKAIGRLNEDETEDDREDELSETVSSEENVNKAVKDFVGCTDILHMRCATHTLQLAIRDGLKEKHIVNVIARLRNIAVAARRPKMDTILRRRAGKVALIDQATRWGSTYEMIQRLLDLKPYLIDMANPDVTMSDLQWEEASQLEVLLKHPYIVTKNFQAAELTPGQFFKEWRRLSYRLSQIGGIVADSIRASMLRREELLLDNNVLLAAIYVDPMHRILLTDEQKAKGKSALYDVAVRMKMLSEGNVDFSEAEICVDNPSSSSESEECDFEKLLDYEEKSKRQRLDESAITVKQSPISKFKFDFTASLAEMEKFDRKSRLNVFEAISVYPDIMQDAARTVSALPPTQVSVERLFSALRLVKTNLRVNLKADITEAILFLRTNSAFS